MSGTPEQIAWAERIKIQVGAEFDSVAASFRAVAGKQTGAKQARTEAVIAILEDKRSTVMARDEAGYFICNWQEIRDQVRQLIFHDAGYQTLKKNTSTLTGG